MIFGLPVVSIGDGAFFGCTSLTSVTLPNSVTNIGSTAFASCSALTSVTLPNRLTHIGSYAFIYCNHLPSLTIPSSVTGIGDWALAYCTSLARVYFQGNAPSLGSSVFSGTNTPTIYYMPGTTNWASTFGDQPATVWRVQPTADASFGVRTNQFGFNITWGSNVVVVVEACTNLVHGVWSPVSTNTLIAGSSYFSDPNWTNYTRRFYRLRSP
jgi:hypothetical protein